jgi:hypothetical protein
LRTISALLAATDATASNRCSRLDLVRKSLARGSREYFHGLLGAREEREALGELDGFEREVDIESGPVEMIAVWTLEIQNFGDRCVPEPRKMIERDKDFAIAENDPETVRGDILNLGLKSGGSKFL